jgi:hypothetical protein
MTLLSVPMVDGRHQEIELNPELESIARSLPYSNTAYFGTVTGHPIPLAKLLHNKVRPGGVANAVRLMKKALEGEIPKRDPITVRALPNGKFCVEDGNSTVTVARFAGWPDIWAILVQPQAPHLPTSFE